MSEAQRDVRAMQRRMRVEAGAWGALVALNAAFVSLLLITRGGAALALAIYASGASLFGLGMGFLGLFVATRTRDASRVTLGALIAARAVFVTVPFLLSVTTEGALSVLMIALLIWAVGEGMAMPLWTAYLAGLSEPSERGRWFAGRATAAAIGAAGALLPMLILVRVTTTERALQVAYLVAALAALVSTLQVWRLFRLAPATTLPGRHAWRIPDSPGWQFLGGVFCFWFGAALNRPVLPPYVVHELHAPAGYFATAAVVAAVSGVGLQRWWGDYGNTKGTRALLGLSGVGAGAAPLLWAVGPDYRLGILVEAVAAGCWLGHLLGLTLHAVELATDDAERASVVAQTQVAQGTAAALGPLVAAGLVGMVGTIPILVASGAICLGSTAMMTGVARPSGRTLTIPLAIRRLHVPLGYESHDPLQAGEGTIRAALLHTGNDPVRDARRDYGVRTRMPLALMQALSADCPSCRGLGCAMCYGSGLG
jgi:MFS family permease